MKATSQSKRERGQSLVELAMSVMVLLILLAGAIDLGRAFFTYIAMRDAAQEGLVYASVYPSSCTQIDQRIHQTIDNAVISETLIEYDPAKDGSWSESCPSVSAAVCSSVPIQVTVRNENFPITMPFLGTLVGSQTIDLTARVTGSVLRPSCP